ncbi:MAG: hypothetical protein GY856_45825 [bacterium]|nr:hypothetical protein [bacterium]
MAQPLIRLQIAGLTLALLIPSLAAGQSTIDFIDENGDSTTEVVESDWARVRVESPAANTQFDVAETVDVDLSTLYAGDFEIVTLTETDV